LPDGRRTFLLREVKMKQLFFGVDIGGTKIAVSAGVEKDEGILILDKVSFPTVKNDYKENLKKIREYLENFRDTYGEAKGIGISCGGPLDQEEGVIQSPPNLPGWDDIPIVEIIKKHMQVPVDLENDADACALAEYRYGAGRGTKNMIFITFGTGLGAGLILGGQLYRGTNNCAGEIGHVRLSKEGPVGFGKEGSFEGYCSGGGIVQLGKLVLSEFHEKNRKVRWKNTAKDIFAAARMGDELAGEIVRRCGQKLGAGLAILVDILNPECIVMGSIYAKNSDLLYPHMMEILTTESLPKSRAACRIVPAQLGDSLGDIGSLCIAARRYRQ